MNTQHTPMRKPGKREARGLTLIRGEMEAMADGMRAYKNPDETKRAEDIYAALRWLRAAIAKATT